MSLTIIPSIGRKVWLYLNATQVEPIDATVIKVHEAPDVATPTSMCNLLAVLPDDGSHRFIHAVQASEEPIDAPHFRWMPYQASQAAKAAEPGLDLANIDMRVDALEGKCAELARYVGLPTAEDLAAADRWPDPSLHASTAQGNLLPGVSSMQVSDNGLETKVYTDGTTATGTAPLPDASPTAGEAANDGPTEAPQTATDTGETPAS